MQQDLCCQIEDFPNNSQRQKIATDMHLSGFSLENIQIALQTKGHPNPSKKLPLHYYQHLAVFDHKGADTLPPHRSCDHKIELKPGTTLPHGPLYNISIEDLKVLQKYLNEQLDKGFIRASKSPAAAPVL
ncbi:hypothetical protein K3495_g9930 [Podosphaera aphanis]|nr:hypothetical protein K3495_g9930 [Podosphaera aphanis]